MKIYHVSQNKESGYHTYPDFVVCAESEEEARNTHPSGDNDNWKEWSRSWCKSPKYVEAECLGEAREGLEKGIICSYFRWLISFYTSQ
jgi:hypothetical protein